MAQTQRQSEGSEHRVLYCRCAYAQVVPEDVKNDVLAGLCASGGSFDTVADLCEMSARRDPALKKIAEGGPVRIVACYERAVRGLFEAAGAPLDKDEVQVLNMRTRDAETLVGVLVHGRPLPPEPVEQEETEEINA